MEPVSSIKIQLECALLCLDLDCNAVFDRSLSRHCPACGGDDTYPLAVWLDRGEGLTRRQDQEPAVRRIRAA
jgi:hypothetical protein